MARQGSILEDLYTDSGGFDANRVGQVLKSMLVIQRGDHSVYFKDEFKAGAENKILAHALVKKLLKSEGVETNSGVSGKETHEKTGLPKGTVDPAFQKLKKDGFLLGKGKSYEIPNHKIEAVLKRLDLTQQKKAQ